MALFVAIAVREVEGNQLFSHTQGWAGHSEMMFRSRMLNLEVAASVSAGLLPILLAGPRAVPSPDSSPFLARSLLRFPLPRACAAALPG